MGEWEPGTLWLTRNCHGDNRPRTFIKDVLAQYQHGAQSRLFMTLGRIQVRPDDVAADVVAGIAEGCVQAGAALIGGETAEMPDMYDDGDYDLAGFCVGAVERSGLT